MARPAWRDGVSLAMTGLLVTVVLFPLVGAAVSRLVGRTSWFLLGLGTTGFALYVLTLLRVPPIVTIIALVIASVAVLLWRTSNFGFWILDFGFRNRKFEIENPKSKIQNWLPSTWALVIAAIPIALLLFITAVKPLNDYDGRAFWLLKAKAITHERQIDGPFFQGRTLHDPRNEYPLLAPLNAAAVMIVSGSDDDRHVRWIYVLTLAALVFHAMRHAGPAAAVIAWIPAFAVSPAGGALTATNDILVGAFAACAFFELVEGTSPLRFGLWISFLALAKNEGLPFALILLAAGVIVFRRRIVAACVPLVVAVATLLIWRSRVPAGDDENHLALLPTLPDRLDRLGPALSRFLAHTVMPDAWGLFWIAVALAFAVLAWQRRWREGLLAGYVIVSMSSVYVAIYMITTWNMQDLVNSSAERLLMHFAGPAIYLIAASVRSR